MVNKFYKTMVFVVAASYQYQTIVRNVAFASKELKWFGKLGKQGTAFLQKGKYWGKMFSCAR